MHDIETRDDLLLLMRAFYSRLLADPTISYIFTEVAKIDLEAHLPHLADFWEQTLFYTGGYKKNVLQLHLDLNAKEKITDAHFNTWLNHFHKTIDEYFAGENAERMKSRAESIATVMKIKIYEH
jgi:hemoglobin